MWKSTPSKGRVLGKPPGFWRVPSEMSMIERPEVDRDFILSLLSSRGHCPSERPGQLLVWGPPSPWSLWHRQQAGGVCSSLAWGPRWGVPSGFRSCPGGRLYTEWRSPSSPRAAFAPERDPPPSWAGHAPEGVCLAVWERGGFSAPNPSGTVHTVETKRNDSSLWRGNM